MENLSLPQIDSTKYFGPIFYPEDLSESYMTYKKNIQEMGQVLIPQWASSIPCGLFGISEDFIEKYQSLDEKLIKNREATFFFKATGDSMIPTLFPGEILVVDRSLTQYERRVCIVVWNGELICKRVFVKYDHVLLSSDNKKFQDIIVSDPDNINIWGVVIARAGEVR